LSQELLKWCGATMALHQRLMWSNCNRIWPAITSNTIVQIFFAIASRPIWLKICSSSLSNQQLKNDNDISIRIGFFEWWGYMIPNSSAINLCSSLPFFGSLAA
jgi:hypothetical protein